MLRVGHGLGHEWTRHGVKSLLRPGSGMGWGRVGVETWVWFKTWVRVSTWDRVGEWVKKWVWAWVS